MPQHSNHPHTRKDWRAWAKFGAKAAITVLLILFLLRGIDPHTVLDNALRTEWRYLAVAVGLVLFNIWLTGMRWFFVIRSIGHRLSLGLSWQVTMIGAFFNQILPSAMGGDLVRFPYAARFGLPLTTALKSVVLDRMIAFVGLIVLVLCCLPAALLIIAETRVHWYLLGVVIAALFFVGVLLSVAYWPSTLLEKSVLRPVLALSKSLRDALIGRHRLRILVCAVMIHVIRVLTVYAVALGMSLQVSFMECLILVPSALLVTNVPVSLGGWGVREGAFMVAFAFVGLTAEQSIALSALFGLSILSASLAGGLVWVFPSRPAGSSRTTPLSHSESR
jgi:glycosyltransferase 2 family protein